MRNSVPPQLITRRKALALSAAGLGACSIPAPTQDSTTPSAESSGTSSACWSTLPPLPFAVQEIYPIAHKQRIHLAGGLIGAEGRVTGVSGRHIAYDPASGETETLSPLPSARHHPQLVSAGDNLFCLGGFETHANMVNWIMSKQTLRYADDGGWEELTPAPESHAETVATILGDRVHIVGGRRNTGTDNMSYGDHTDSDSHLVFDTTTNTWSRGAPALAARNSAAGAVINGNWHVVGGRTVTGGPMDNHEVYDAAEDRWRSAAPLPEGIGAGGNAAGIISGHLYVFGGEFFGPDGGVHAEVCRYDPATDTWEIVGDMPTPRHGLGGVTLNNAIYAVGGATRPSGNGTSATIERLALTCA